MTTIGRSAATRLPLLTPQQAQQVNDLHWQAELGLLDIAAALGIDPERIARTFRTTVAVGLPFQQPVILPPRTAHGRFSEVD